MMRRRLGSFLLPFAAFLAASGTAPAAEAPVGVYVWGGYYREDASLAGLAASLRFVLDRGFSTIRIAVTPHRAEEMRLGAEICPTHRDLGCFLDRILAEPVFQDPRLKTLMLTLSDFTTEPGRQLDPAFVAAHHEAIAGEYRGALAAIDRRLGGHPLDVVLSNWEGDNLVYCGGVYRYATDPRARLACAGGTQAGIKSRLDGLMAWLALRREAVAGFHPRSPNLRLHDAVEFNSLHILEQECKTGGCAPALSVFKRLAAGPRPELCSYSAYDGLKRGMLEQDIETMLRFCDKAIIGEIGFPGQAAAGYAAAAPVVLRHRDRIFAIIFWNAFESKNATDKGYGLWTAEGAPRAIDALPPSLRP